MFASLQIRTKEMGDKMSHVPQYNFSGRQCPLPKSACAKKSIEQGISFGRLSKALGDMGADGKLNVKFWGT